MPQRNRIRLRVAQEAARIMHEQGVREYDLARRKAARRLGVAASRSAPRDEEIDAALREYQRIYNPESQADTLLRLRRLAAEAMKFLAPFAPLLCGSVWDGTAGRHSAITLHLFTDESEAVQFRLADAGIPFEESEHILFDKGRPQRLPAFAFYADGVRIELLLFDERKKYRGLRRKGGQKAGGNLEQLDELVLNAV
jgi:hypothetical protein